MKVTCDHCGTTISTTQEYHFQRKPYFVVKFFEVDRDNNEQKKLWFTLCRKCTEHVTSFIFGDYSAEIKFREFDKGIADWEPAQ